MIKDDKSAKDDKIDVDKLAVEASLLDADTIRRQVIRGDETKGDPDQRDAAGAPPASDTPRKREETKNSTLGVEDQHDG